MSEEKTNVNLRETEVRGVRLLDVFRDEAGELWEVVGLCVEPSAIVRNIETGKREQHVIGCLNWTSKWESGPLRDKSENAR